MKSLLTIFCALATTLATAQSGIQFFEGSWKDALAKAKAENKLIFIDVYTSWCGPCKLMVKDIFPLKKVGDLFNSGFINYKIDAEKGEGIAVAKKYEVKGYPTYLFVNGDGVLYYRSSGSMPEDRFIQEAKNALTEFQDPKPLPLWDEEYPSKKNNKEFLIGYLKKRQKLRLNSDEVVDQLVSISTKEELLSNEILGLLLKQESARADGAYFQFLTKNKAEIEQSGLVRGNNLDNQLVQYLTADLKRAISKKDITLLNHIVGVRSNLPSRNPIEWETGSMKMNFYAQTGNEKELIKVLEEYSYQVLSYDKSIIRAGNEKSLKQFEELVKQGRYENSTEEEIAVVRSFYANMEGTPYAYRVRDMADAVLKAVNDKVWLNYALNWMHLASAYSDNFTILEINAGVLHKLGRKDEAIKYQQAAIDAYNRLKLDNEIISSRLTSNFQKIKEGKPTWIENKSETVVTGK